MSVTLVGRGFYWSLTSTGSSVGPPRTLSLNVLLHFDLLVYESLVPRDPTLGLRFSVSSVGDL